MRAQQWCQDRVGRLPAVLLRGLQVKISNSVLVSSVMADLDPQPPVAQVRVLRTCPGMALKLSHLCVALDVCSELCSFLCAESDLQPCCLA